MGTGRSAFAMCHCMDRRLCGLSCWGILHVRPVIYIDKTRPCFVDIKNSCSVSPFIWGCGKAAAFLYRFMIMMLIRNPLIFSSKNGFLLMFLAGPKFKNPPSCKPSSDFRPFDPGIIMIISYTADFLYSGSPAQK